MQTVNCYIPLKLRLRGELSEDDWASLEEALVARYTRTLRRSITQLTQSRFIQAGMPEEVRESFASERVREDDYVITSYDRGELTQAPLLTRRAKTPDPLHSLPERLDPGTFKIALGSKHEFIFYFNKDEALQWGKGVKWYMILFGYFFRNFFSGDTDRINALAGEFVKAGKFKVEFGSPLESWTKPVFGIAFSQTLYEEVVLWMATYYEDAYFTRPALGIHSTEKPSPSRTTLRRGLRPQRRRLPEGTKTSEGGIIQFDPAGKMKLLPVQPKYVIDSEATAFVEFDDIDPECYMLNFSPKRARFDWTIFRNNRLIDSEINGGIKYTFKVPSPSDMYKISVRITSDYFIGGKSLDLSLPIITATASERLRELFTNLLVDEIGNDPSKPFVRDATGKLKLKDAEEGREFSVHDQIKYIEFQRGVIEELLKQGRLSKVEADTSLASLNELYEDLKQFSKGEIVNKPLYIVRGIFLNTKDSSSQPIHAFMHQTQRLPADKDGKVWYQVTLYDSTQSPGKLIRHTGNGDAFTSEGSPYVRAEKKAIDEMAEDWHLNNDYPDGIVRLAIQLLETGEIYEKDILTHSYRKTVKTGLTLVAGVGSAVLIVAAPLTAGTTAAIGVVILEGIVAGAVIADVALRINERLTTGTFKFDKEFVMDMLMIVTLALGSFGSIAKAFSSLRPLAKGMHITNLALNAATLIVISAETSKAISDVEAQYAVLIGMEEDFKKKNELRQKRDEVIAGILGHAAVNGGLMLVNTVVSISHLVTSAGTPPAKWVEPTTGGPSKPPIEPPIEGGGPPKKPSAESQPKPSEAGVAVKPPTEKVSPKPEPPKTEPPRAEQRRARAERKRKWEEKAAAKSAARAQIEDAKERKLAQIENARERKLQIYSEIEEATQSGKQRLTHNERKALEQEKAELARQAKVQIDIENRLRAEFEELQISQYERARVYSHSDAASKEIYKRSRGLDEMSGKLPSEPSIDHIVSIEEMATMEGFDALVDADLYEVLSNVKNLRLMEKAHNSSKGSKRWADWLAGRRLYGEDVWSKMVELERELRREIQADIKSRTAKRKRSIQ